jgi:G3E family GTPase
MTTPTIPVVVVAGYLGAGKTTFINDLLSTTTNRIAVVVNDFGSINIDAALISSVNSDTIELTNGCVCCALGGTLADTMLEIADRPQQPDMVVIEASGVSDPAAVSANAYIGGFHLAATLVLVDAVNAQQTLTNKLVGETFVRQLNAAHLLLITKDDTATTEQYALCIDICESTSLPYMLRSQFSIESLNTDVPLDIPVGLSDAVGPSFSSQLLDLMPVTSLQDLRREMDNLPYSVVRAKGIVCVDSQNYLVQRVGTYVSITATLLAPTGIVVIHAD